MYVAGSHIGKYVLDKKLGHGGFGVVFSAHDATLDRRVALKFLRAEHMSDREVVHRFLNEARSAAKIVHPGIVTIFECGQVDDAAYIAMELLEGETLTARLARSGRMSAPDTLEIGRQLASALGAAHRAGVVHRDLKPDNIILVPDSTALFGERLKVLDFGIAKLANQTTSSLQTQSMMVFGTPRYMSPEQCRSAANVDARSDIYTLGCIMFELLTGRPPFEGQPGELIAFHLMVEAPDITERAPSTPPGLVQLVADMLQKDPAHRPQTMAAVQQALEVCGAPVVGPPPTVQDSGLLPTILPAFDTVPFSPVPPHETTTLSSAIVAVPRTTPSARRSRMPLFVYAAAALIVIAVPIAVWFALHDKGGDDRAQVAAEALARPSAQPPAATPPPPQPVAPPKVSPIASPTEVGRAALPEGVRRSIEEPAPVVAPAPKGHPAGKSKKPAEKHVVAAVPAPASPAPEPKVDPNGTTNPFETAARGTMSIVSKPPCEIYIDGQSVGLHTPQRSLTLTAGKHKVQLVNEELGIKDQFTVEIKPGVIERVGKEYATSRDATINPFAKGGS